MISNSTAAWKETTRNSRKFKLSTNTAGVTKTIAATLGMFVVKMFILEKREETNIS